MELLSSKKFTLDTHSSDMSTLKVSMEASEKLSLLLFWVFVPLKKAITMKNIPAIFAFFEQFKVRECMKVERGLELVHTLY